uniref:C-type lectin domain-containing protein n=1 Tax=Stegastes partitus TaxID=144197 RepID=A0A3B5AHS3_9TELE
LRFWPKESHHNETPDQWSLYPPNCCCLQITHTSTLTSCHLIQDDPCPKCEEGWEHHRGRCYYFTTNKSPWEESRNECRDKGGDLVKIDGQDEQTFLERRLREAMIDNTDKFWIGLTDSQEEGRWLWVDGSPLDTRFDSSSTYLSTTRNLHAFIEPSCKVPHKSICEKKEKRATCV